MRRYTAVVSEKACEYIKALTEHFNVIALPPDTSLDDPVSCHADMIMFSVGDTAVLPRRYVEVYPDTVSLFRTRCGLRIIEDNSPRGKQYPHDVSLNVLLCGGYAFSLKKHTSGKVAEILSEKDIKHVNVRQGYSACSSLSIEGGIITADPSIASAAESVGLDVLKITPGYIRLDGYSEGFIGGASGVCGKTVYFLGNIMTHPDKENIRGFLETHGYDMICLGNGELEDFGGIRFFDSNPIPPRE